MSPADFQPDYPISRPTRPTYTTQPKILGRYCYLCFSRDLFNVLFVPFVGVAATIIARNLPENEAKDLITSLNNELDTTERNINTQTFEEGEG